MSNYDQYEIERHAGVFKALSNPHRLHVFRQLASCCAPGMSCPVEYNQPLFVIE